VDILETDVVVNGNRGLVCTIQCVNVVLKIGDAKRLIVRETDCFERRNGEWKLVHRLRLIRGRLGREGHNGLAVSFIQRRFQKLYKKRTSPDFNRRLRLCC